MATSKSLLPAFLAGFAACGGLAAALWPTLILPYEHHLQHAREETAATNRILSQERLMQSQIDAARESTVRLARETCEQQVAQAISDAERRCTSAHALAVSEAEELTTRKESDGGGGGGPLQCAPCPLCASGGGAATSSRRR